MYNINKHMKKIALLILPLLLLGTGCNSTPGSDNPPDPPPKPKVELTFSPTNPVVKVGKTLQITTTNYSGLLTWSSDSTTIASVDNNGLVTGVSAGSTYLHAWNSVDNVEGSLSLTVEQEHTDYKAVNDPSPEAIEVSISTLINKSSSDTTHLYRIKGIVEQNTYSTKGVFDISDASGYIEVYGCGSTKSSIQKNGNTYSYVEQKSYGSLDGKIHAGDEVIIEGIYTIYQSWKNIKEFQGYVVGYTPMGKSIPSIPYPGSDTYSGNYYNNVDLSVSGNTLMSNLQTKMFETHDFSKMTYNGLYSGYSKTGETSGSYYKCFYTGKTYSKSNTNREHVWAQSLSIPYPGSQEQLWGETGGGCDLHHIRPTYKNVNSTRSSLQFGSLFGYKSSTIDTTYGSPIKYTETTWEVPDKIKGDVARIVLYTYMHYNSGFSGIEQRQYTGGLCLYCLVVATNVNQAMKILKYWNAIDPVDDIEKQRNEGAFNVQGNRNPFIDYPTLVDRL